MSLTTLMSSVSRLSIETALLPPLPLSRRLMPICHFQWLCRCRVMLCQRLITWVLSLAHLAADGKLHWQSRERQQFGVKSRQGFWLFSNSSFYLCKLRFQAPVLIAEFLSRIANCDSLSLVFGLKLNVTDSNQSRFCAMYFDSCCIFVARFCSRRRVCLGRICRQ